MSHSDTFWSRYVFSVSPKRVAKFWELVNYGFGGQTAADRALDGIMYAHEAAIKEAYALCRK